MAIPEGLRTSLNSIRETSIQNNTLYHRYVPEILPTSDIGSFASPILDNPNVMNEFMNVLVQRIVYTQVDIKLFNNPLRVLEGDRIPLGSIGQEIFINPAKGRKFNVDDFAGLLAKYEADIKVQYHHFFHPLFKRICVWQNITPLKRFLISVIYIFFRIKPFYMFHI